MNEHQRTELVALQVLDVLRQRQIVSTDRAQDAEVARSVADKLAAADVRPDCFSREMDDEYFAGFVWACVGIFCVGSIVGAIYAPALINWLRTHL